MTTTFDCSVAAFVLIVLSIIAEVVSIENVEAVTVESNCFTVGVTVIFVVILCVVVTVVASEMWICSLITL